MRIPNGYKNKHGSIAVVSDVDGVRPLATSLAQCRDDGRTNRLRRASRKSKSGGASEREGVKRSAIGCIAGVRAGGAEPDETDRFSDVS